jgi:hypothetical protein
LELSETELHATCTIQEKGFSGLKELQCHHVSNKVYNQFTSGSCRYPCNFFIGGMDGAFIEKCVKDFIAILYARLAFIEQILRIYENFLNGS